jgi:transposase InsO family protein
LPRVRDDEGPLTHRIIELAGVYGRYGSPRITGLIRNSGKVVNHKRVERIWKAEGLKVPKKQPKRGRLWFNDGSCIRLRPERRDHVWAYDFVLAATHEGRPFRMLTLVDEYTRECLAIDVARRLRSDDVLERLSWLFATRGVPAHVRSDNGPEFTAKVVRGWLGRVGVKPLFIEPGSPWENGYVESFTVS